MQFCTVGDGEMMTFFLDASGSPYGYNYYGMDYYFTKNAQGDVIALLDEYGYVCRTYSYDAWGKLISITDEEFGGEVTSEYDPAILNPFRYRSYYCDNETGFYYLKSRYYDPAVCRFISADDVSNLGANCDLASLNLFAYCGNDPINRADDGGDFWHIVIGAAIGGLIGGISSIVGQAVSGEKINWAEVGVSAATGALSGAISAACPGMGAVATGLVQGAIGAGSHIATELVNGRTPTVAGTLTAGATSGILAGGMKAVSQHVSSKYLEDIVKSPEKIQGQSLNKVKLAANLSPDWETGTLSKGMHAGLGWKATGLGDALIQWHPGGGHHYSGNAYWKVSSGSLGKIRFPY